MSKQNRYKEECSNMNFTERRILFSLWCLTSHIVLYSNSYQDACSVICTEFTIAYRNYLPYNVSDIYIYIYIYIGHKQVSGERIRSTVL